MLNIDHVTAIVFVLLLDIIPQSHKKKAKTSKPLHQPYFLYNLSLVGFDPQNPINLHQP